MRVMTYELWLLYDWVMSRETKIGFLPIVKKWFIMIKSCLKRLHVP